MIRHILSKDLRLLWPFATALALVPFALTMVDLQRGHFRIDDAALGSFLLLLELAFYLGAAALMLTLIHQDSLVGVRQDWLARPIRRRDLLAAKLVFVLATVQLPMLLANLLEGLLDGFSFGHALVPALSQNIWLLIAFTIPVLAIASLTRNMTTATAYAVGIFVAVMCGAILLKIVTGNPLGPTQATAIAWIPGAARLLIFVTASVMILLLQFFHRRTRASIAVLAAALVLSVIPVLAPWPLVFRLQQRLSPIAPDAGAVRISLQTSAGTASPLKKASLTTTREISTLHVPITVSGLPPGSMLKVDRAVVFAQPAGSRHRILLSRRNLSSSFHVPGYTADGAVSNSYNETLHLRPRAATAIQSSRVTLYITYSATLLRPSLVQRLAPVGANLRLKGIGWCQTRLDESQTGVELRCLQIGHPSQCLNTYLENPATGRRNPGVQGCRGSYKPWFGRYKPLDTTAFMGANLPFHDPAGLVHYPVGASQLQSAVVVLRTYQPEAHFTRTLTIPDVPLRAFAGQP